MLGLGLNRSKDSETFDTRVQAALLGQDVELDNDWYHLFAELQGGRWFGWTSYAEFHSRPRGSAELLMSSGGALRERLRSRAFTAGLSRTLAWPGRATGARSAWGCSTSAWTTSTRHARAFSAC